MISGISAVWLPVTDMDRAVTFYGDTLGMTVVDRQSEWSELELGSVKIGLNGRPQESPDGDGGAAIAFAVDSDIEAEVDRLRSAGVEFTGGVSDHDWGRIAPFKDPDGNDLQLFQSPN